MLAVAVLNTGALIRKGRDRLRIETRGIDFTGDIPLLDMHSLSNPPLGHVNKAWLAESAGDDLLMASLVFDNNRAGRRVYEMVERGELTGISCGLQLSGISILDGDGVPLDDDEALEREDDPNLIFHVRRSILQEVSLCASPVDPAAIVRACSDTAVAWEMIHRGEERLRRLLRPDRGGDDEVRLRDIMPDRRMVLYGAPERLITG